MAPAAAKTTTTTTTSAGGAAAGAARMAATTTTSRISATANLLQPSPLRISTTANNSSSSSKQPITRARSPSPRMPPAYPDASDILILEPRQLPILTSTSALSSAATSPISRRKRRTRTGSDASINSSGSSNSGSIGSSSSSSNGGRRRSSISVGKITNNNDSDLLSQGDFSLEAELASAISEEDGGSFFSIHNTSVQKSRSPSISTITSPAHEWSPVEEKHHKNGDSARAGGEDESATSASVSGSTTSGTSASGSGLGLDESRDDALDPSPSYQQKQEEGSFSTGGRTPLPPSLFVYTTEDDHDGPALSPSPFPSPPRTIPSLPPRLDISDFGIYSAAPSPAPSPVSTPPNQVQRLPRLGSGTKGALEVSGMRGGAGALAIPDHLPPLNLPQTPLSLPAVLPEITLTSPSAMADLAPLSLLSSAHSVSLLHPALHASAPSFGRRHTDPGTQAGGADGALLPAPAEFGGASASDGSEAQGDATADGSQGLPQLPRGLRSVPSFLGLNGHEEAVELERRLRQLTSSFDEEDEPQA
ncbi:hypothetical protein CF326_g5758 [Tilletia indica]|nr:hypothetical protein CF326_g5758 [Tilletia indica]